SYLRVADRYPESVVLIVGDGPLRPQLENFAKQRSDNQLIFTGSIEDVGGAISASAIYAHISLQEGLPISLLNAMAHGKPVLASPIGGIPEAIRNDENGLLVESDVVSLCHALDRLLSDSSLRSRLGKAAAESARSQFSWSKTLDEFLRSYGVAQ